MPGFEDTPGTPFKTIGLRTIFLHVTKACNLRCVYCYSSAGEPLPNEMSTEEYQRLWPELVELRPLKVVFSGGEPLLRPDLLDLLAGLQSADPEHRVRRCLNTNGCLMNAEMARKLAGTVDEMRVSLDAPVDVNDTLRGGGSYQAALRALEVLSSNGFQPLALVTVSAANLGRLRELLDLLSRKGITRIKLNLFHAVGRGQTRPDLEVTFDDAQRALGWRSGGQASCKNCGVGSYLNIAPNGEVFPCHVLTDPQFRCGSVREQSLAKICHRDGLLGSLQSLDFLRLAQQDERLAGLARPAACLGDVLLCAKWDTVASGGAGSDLKGRLT